MSKALRLVWIDIEMSGLDPAKDKILELAMIITDHNLQKLATAPVWVVHQTNEILDTMDKWNTSTHTKSGLIDRVKNSRNNETEVEKMAIEFLNDWVDINSSPICGNSVHQDRRFLYTHMPQLEAFFHYRNLDVSTIKELVRRWAPDLYKQTQKQKESKHEALADIEESIAELIFYRQEFIKY